MEKRHRKSVAMHMSREVKAEWLPKLRMRYARRGREGKSRILDELCEDYGYERKYAIKLLGDCLPPPSGRRRAGPDPRYGLIEPSVRQGRPRAQPPRCKRRAPTL